MKMRHDVDATTLPKAKRAIIGATLALAVAAGSVAAATPPQAKARHDVCCYQPTR